MRITASGRFSAGPAAVLFLPFLLMPSVPSTFGQGMYSVTDLGPGRAYSINNSGQAVGITAAGNGFFYSAGVLKDLGGNYAYAVNASGQVVGLATNGHAFLYSGGAMLDLGTLGGTGSVALGINDTAQVVGHAQKADGTGRAFLYTQGIMTDLGTFGGDESDAWGINNSGQIAGFAKTADGQGHAFVYSQGTMTDLGTLDGGNSEAVAINNNGQAVGFVVSTGEGCTRGFWYSGGGGLVGLQCGSLGQGVNNNGQVVGVMATGAGRHAFLYSGGTMTDLNTCIDAGSGWTLDWAYSINDKGQIAGSGQLAGEDHAIILTPLSQPSPGPLLSISVSGADLVVCWPTNSAGLTLYQNPSLLTSNWAPVTNTPMVTNGRNQLVIPSPVNGRCFYRLQSQ